MARVCLGQLDPMHVRASEHVVLRGRRGVCATQAPSATTRNATLRTCRRGISSTCGRPTETRRPSETSAAVECRHLLSAPLARLSTPTRQCPRGSLRWSRPSTVILARNAAVDGKTPVAADIASNAAVVDGSAIANAAEGEKVRERGKLVALVKAKGTVDEEDGGLRGEESGRENAGHEEEKENGEKEGEGEGEGGDVQVEPGYKMSRVCDRLIEVFWIEKPDPEDWRKLLAFSEEWSNIRPHFFRRCQARAKEMEEEGKPDKAAELYKLGRRLREVDEGMREHNELFKLCEESEGAELEGIVARRRKDFTGEFFAHLRTICEASYKDLSRQDEIAKMSAKILNTVQLHDQLVSDEAAVEVAQTKFDEIMNSGTLEEACNKIDSLAARQQLDSTLMLMITKAWAAAKESNMMKDEVKDVMYHLYMQALGNMRMLVPKEVRILRHVLSLEDPREMVAALTAAFSPGDELEVQNAPEDYLYTTPDDLLRVVDQVLDAYYMNRQSTLIDEAKKLMRPSIIRQLEILKQIIIDQFK